MGDFLSILTRFAREGRSIAPEHLFDIARQERFDGALTIHFRGGIPRKVEGGHPTQVTLDPSQAEGS